MAFGVGRALTTPLAVINFILYLIAAALAGWALNKYIDGSGVGNAATQWFLPIALIASVVGLASILAGTHHLRVYRTDSLSAAHAAALIAWLLTLLAMGLAAKEIHIGGARGGRLKTLEALLIILSLFQLLYLLSLHSGLLGSNYGPTYNNAAGTGTGTGVGPKAGNYGTPAAAAV
ncbi:unnamed protein product [Sphagnum jensenii]|uniref:Uncharacterized protein n=2 Tax=Sphagnum jensenii TaxID=128206 RepID=A0ABP1BDB4_9BRYO